MSLKTLIDNYNIDPIRYIIYTKYTDEHFIFLNVETGNWSSAVNEATKFKDVRHAKSVITSEGELLPGGGVAEISINGGNIDVLDITSIDNV